MNGQHQNDRAGDWDVRVLRWALTSDLAETARKRLQSLDQRIRKTPAEALDARWRKFLEHLDDLIGRVPPAE